ncbi:hypothetical protein TNCV_5062461 [Trichonephila clavipes]|nr:hypothetical protein TNCV_5062461 [Trichonephila clavipes]
MPSKSTDKNKSKNYVKADDLYRRDARGRGCSSRSDFPSLSRHQTRLVTCLLPFIFLFHSRCALEAGERATEKRARGSTRGMTAARENPLHARSRNGIDMLALHLGSEEGRPVGEALTSSCKRNIQRMGSVNRSLKAF